MVCGPGSGSDTIALEPVRSLLVEGDLIPLAQFRSGQRATRRKRSRRSVRTRCVSRERCGLMPKPTQPDLKMVVALTVGQGGGRYRPAVVRDGLSAASMSDQCASKTYITRALR